MKRIVLFVLTLCLCFSFVALTACDIQVSAGTTAPTVRHTVTKEEYEAALTFEGVSAATFSFKQIPDNVVMVCEIQDNKLRLTQREEQQEVVSFWEVTDAYAYIYVYAESTWARMKILPEQDAYRAVMTIDVISENCFGLFVSLYDNLTYADGYYSVTADGNKLKMQFENGKLTYAYLENSDNTGAEIVISGYGTTTVTLPKTYTNAGNYPG